MASHEHETGTTKQPIGLNRRTLIRTGAHVAWAVPAVAMVTPAPAAAASGPAALSVTATNGGWTGDTTADARFAITFDVTNNNTAETTALTVKFTLPTGFTASVTSPLGWTVSGNQSNSITLTRSTQLKGNVSTGPVVVTFKPIQAAAAAFKSTLVNITAAPGATGTSGTTITTVAAPGAAFSVTATNGGWTGNSTPNALFSITFNVTNTGTAAATGLQTAFTFPAGVTIANVTTPAGWFWASGSGTNVITLGRNGSLNAGASAGGTVTFDPVDTSVGTSIPVSIMATSNAPSTPGSTSTTVAAAGPPALTISGGTWSPAGVRMNFAQRTLGNTSFTPTTGLKVVFTLPTGLRDVVSATATGDVVWNAVLDPSVATTGIITFTAAGQLPGKATKLFTAAVVLNSNVDARTGTVSIVVSATNPGATSAIGTAARA